MKSFANNLLFRLAVLLISSISAAAQDVSVQSGGQQAAEKPEPCVCKKESGDIDCPGETHCSDGQWSSCQCDSKGQCVGQCYDETTRDAIEFAARVLSKVTDETVTRENVVRESKKYAPILESLLRSKARVGTYTVEYQGRTTSFGFTGSAVRLLTQASAELARQRNH